MGWWSNEEYQAISRKLDDMSAKLDSLNTSLSVKLNAVLTQGKQLMAKTDDVRVLITKLRTDVADQTTVIGGVGTLLGNLSKIITELKTQVAAADNIPQDIVDSVTAIDQAVIDGKDVLAKDVKDNTQA